MLAIDNGFPKEQRRKSLTGFRMHNGQYLRGTGGGDAGQIWRAAMTAALKDKPKTKFVEPSKSVKEGKKVPVPDVSGKGYDEAKRTIEAAGFSTQQLKVYSSRPSGTFLGASPSKEAPIYSTISLRISAGPRPAPKPKPQPKPKESQPATPPSNNPQQPAPVPPSPSEEGGG